MTHSYAISGMTCNNCVARVKSELLKIGDITGADVQLSSPQATITMQTHIPVSTLQKALTKAGNFQITPAAQTMVMHSHEEEEDAAGWKRYWPLILVFGFITGISIITSMSSGVFYWMDFMNNFMGGFFVSFSFFKLLDLRGFAESYSTYDLLATRWTGYGWIYPFFELALGVAYIVRWEPVVTNLSTIVIMAFSSIGVIRSVLQKRKIKCACLGTVFNLPMSTVTIVEDVLMIVMATIMVVHLF